MRRLSSRRSVLSVQAVDGVVDYAACGLALLAIDPVGELHASGETEIWDPEEDRFV
jgi:hypothetical protein